MACTDKDSNLCVDSTLSTCVDFEGPLGENTKIISDCVTQSDVNTDLYSITDEIITAIDVATIVGDCITIPTGATIVEVVVLLKEKVCALDAQVTTLETIDYSQLDITGWGLIIPTCIADACGVVPTTLGSLLQVLMDNRNCT